MSKKKPDTEYTPITHQEIQSDKNSEEIALIKQSLEYMKTGIDEIKDSFKQLRADLVSGFVTKEKFDAKIDSLEKEVKDIKSFKEWAVRLTMGAVALAGLAALLTGSK